ncbi:hypothetical protein, partial [Mycobacteroides abscessus]|uniref:hypothetical protein n=1 Tax=Mycobacteroides abscessus TaxID=36809 RepID=UPI001A99D498
LDQTFDIQIILGKVRPFLRRLAEAHPQVLIIAPIEAAKPLRSNCSEDLCKTTRLEARTCLAKTSTRTIGGSIATIKTVV